MTFLCPSCQNNQYTKKLSCKDYTVSHETFDLVECNKCGLLQTFPYPSSSFIQKYYDSPDYISHSDTDQDFFQKIYHQVRKITLRQKLNLLKKIVPRGTVLDFGCGTGYFLEFCKKNGFEVLGVEPNATALKKCLEKNIGVFDDLSKINYGKFDVITLWHVFEHLYDPKLQLSAFGEKLKDGGFLILALPNPNSFDAKKFKQFWAGYDVPRHLFHYTKKDILNLVNDQFKVLSVHPMVFDAFYVSILSERYKGKSFSFLSGMFWGLLSNISAFFSKEYSSLIYVLQKK